MNEQRKTNIKVGVSVILALILLGWIWGWAKNISIASDYKNIEIIFPTVAGLEVGDPVTVNGVRKGYVGDISVTGNSAKLSALLENNVVLQEDATFSVMMLDLMGGKKLEIKPGNSTVEINYSEVQEGQFLGDIPSVMAMFGNVQGDLLEIIKKTNVTLTSLNEFLTDEEFKTDVKSTADNLSQVTDKIDRLINENQADLKKLLQNSVELTTTITKFIESNSGKVDTSLVKMNETLTAANSLLANMDAFLAETKAKENNLGKALYDEKFLLDVKDTLKKLDALIQTMNKQLEEDGLEISIF